MSVTRNEGICEKHGMKLVVNPPHGHWYYTCLPCRLEALEGNYLKCSECSCPYYHTAGVFCCKCGHVAKAIP